MGAYFVKRRCDGVHCIVRIVPNSLGCTLPELDGPAVRELVTRLATAKTLTTLSRAVDELPLLLPRAATHIIPLGALEGRISERYEPCDKKRLARESVYHVIGQDPTGDSAAVSAAMTRYDGLAGRFAREVSTTRQDAFSVVEEPLLDWLYVRAQLGLTGRLLDAVSASPTAPLEQAGFERSYVPRLSREVWHLRFLHCAFHEPRRAMARCSPLFDAAAGNWNEAEGPKRPPFLIPPRCQRQGSPSDRAFFLTSQSIASQKTPEDGARDQSLHVCVDDGGQPRGALDVLVSLKHAADGLVVGAGAGALYAGFDDDPTCWTTRPASMHPKPLSLLPDLTYRLLDRGFQRISVCRECGCPMLQNDKGRVKEYCSTVCRNKHIDGRER